MEDRPDLFPVLESTHDRFKRYSERQEALEKRVAELQQLYQKEKQMHEECRQSLVVSREQCLQMEETIRHLRDEVINLKAVIAPPPPNSAYMATGQTLDPVAGVAPVSEEASAAQQLQGAGIIESHEATARENIGLSDAQLKQIKDEQKQAALVGDKLSLAIVLMKDEKNSLALSTKSRQKQAALVVDKLPFAVFFMEYDVENSPFFTTESRERADIYSHIRPIARDGNCFYRSILAREVELLFSNPEELARFEAVCKGWRQRLIDLRFPDWTISDICEYFFDWIKLIKNKEKTIEEVFTDLNDVGHSTNLVIFLRFIASGYLKENTAVYERFVDQGLSLAEYCESEIEPLWKFADQLAITGLVLALGLGIRVEYIDRSHAPNGGWYYDFPPNQAESPKITLLYRPGHYDLIYKMDPVN